MMRLSIITVNLNNAEGLSRTIASVRQQTVPPFEFIVIDGGSSDASLEVLKKSEDAVSFWSSEKDRGIYDGMNKGILSSAGDYLLFLNSGDTLSSADVLEKLSSGESADVVHGMSRLFRPDGTWIHYGKKSRFPKFQLFHAMLFSHQAAIFRKNLFLELGLYDTSFRIVSDYDIILKAFFAGKTFSFTDMVIADYQLGGVSNQNSILRQTEHRIARKRRYPLLLWIILTILHFPGEIAFYKKKLFLSLLGKDIVIFKTGK